MLRILITGLPLLLTITALLYTRRRTDQHYIIAKKDYDEANPYKAVRFLRLSLRPKRNNVYSYNEAQKYVASLELLKDVLQDFNLNKDDLINPVLSSFKLIPSEGGSVSKEDFKRLSLFLRKMAVSEQQQNELIEQELAKGNYYSIGDTEDRCFTEELTDENQVLIIDEIDEYIYDSKFNEALSCINEHIPNENNMFKMCLLQQKATIYVLQDDYKASLQVYEAITKVHPDNVHTQYGLAASLIMLREDKSRATELLHNIIENSSSRDTVLKARKLLSLLSNW